MVFFFFWTCCSVTKFYNYFNSLDVYVFLRVSWEGNQERRYTNVGYWRQSRCTSTQGNDRSRGQSRKRVKWIKCLGFIPQGQGLFKLFSFYWVFTLITVSHHITLIAILMCYHLCHIISCESKSKSISFHSFLISFIYTVFT